MRKRGLLLALVLMLVTTALAEEIVADPVEAAVEDAERALWTQDMADAEALPPEIAAPEADAEALPPEIAAPEADAEALPPEIAAPEADAPKGGRFTGNKEWTEGDFRYELVTDRSLGLTGARLVRYDGSDSSVIIPPVSNEYTVRFIGDAAFAGRHMLDVDIPDTVKKIGNSAFSDTYLTSVKIPGGVVSIGAYAFSNCRYMSSAYLASGLEFIGRCAFYGCDSLKSVDLPNTVTTLGEYAFCSCHALKEVSLSSALKAIEPYTFNECTSLTSVSVPSTVETIGTFAFLDCSKLEYVSFRQGLKAIEKGAFEGTRIRAVAFPNSLQSIGDTAFFKCDSLSSVKFGDGLKRIGNYAFSQCDRLEEIYIPESVTSIGNGAFLSSTGYSKDENPNLTIRCEVGSYAEAWAKERGYRTKNNAHVHTPQVIPGRAPTCTEAGLTDGSVCAECGEILAGQKGIPATGHTPQALPGKAATADEPGLTEGTICAVCGAILVPQAVIPVLEPEMRLSINACSASVRDQIYTGRALKPAPVVLDGEIVLTNKADYKLTYQNNRKVGTATVILWGLGDYEGTKALTFDILPRGTSLSKLTGGKKKITVSWRKQARATQGYQIQYSLKKNFSGAKTVTVRNSGTTSTTLKKLKAKKKYYVRIRTYAKVGVRTYPSPWSAVMTVKTK